MPLMLFLQHTWNTKLSYFRLFYVDLSSTKINLLTAVVFFFFSLWRSFYNEENWDCYLKLSKFCDLKRNCKSSIITPFSSPKLFTFLKFPDLKWRIIFFNSMVSRGTYIDKVFMTTLIYVMHYQRNYVSIFLQDLDYET